MKRLSISVGKGSIYPYRNLRCWWLNREDHRCRPRSLWAMRFPCHIAAWTWPFRRTRNMRIRWTGRDTNLLLLNILWTYGWLLFNSTHVSTSSEFAVVKPRLRRSYLSDAPSVVCILSMFIFRGISFLWMFGLTRSWVQCWRLRRAIWFLESRPTTK